MGGRCALTAQASPSPHTAATSTATQGTLQQVRGWLTLGGKGADGPGSRAVG